VDPSPPAGATYQWNTGCFTNNFHTDQTCFPAGQTTQSVTGDNLLAEDAGTITCTVTIGASQFTSNSFTLRIASMYSYTVQIITINAIITAYSVYLLLACLDFMWCASGIR